MKTKCCGNCKYKREYLSVPSCLGLYLCGWLDQFSVSEIPTRPFPPWMGGFNVVTKNEYPDCEAYAERSEDDD